MNRLLKLARWGGAIVSRDLRKANNARKAILKIDPEEIVERLQTAGNLYALGTVEVGGVKQSPDDFARQQSATTGLPENLCLANMKKNLFVLSNMDRMLDALSRGLPPEVFLARIRNGAPRCCRELPGPVSCSWSRPSQ